MHKLRWPELKTYFAEKYEEAKANDDWDAESSLLGIVESFEDNWGDAQDLYFEFFGN